MVSVLFSGGDRIYLMKEDQEPTAWTTAMGCRKDGKPKFSGTQYTGNFGF